MSDFLFEYDLPMEAFSENDASYLAEKITNKLEESKCQTTMKD